MTYYRNCLIASSIGMTLALTACGGGGGGRGERVASALPSPPSVPAAPPPPCVVVHPWDYC